MLFCGEHGETEHNILLIDGKPLTVVCLECAKKNQIQETKSETAREQRDFAEKLRSFQRKANFPRRFMNKFIWNYSPKNERATRAHSICERYSEKFDNRYENGGGLILCGMPGTGKTHLAIGIAWEALADGYRVQYDSAINIIREVRSSYGKDSNKTETEIINKFINLDLLIVDEVGVQYGTDSEKIILFDVINGRYNNVKPTIIISNLNIQELSSYIGDRVVDRMREGGGAVLSFDWDSERK